MTYKTIIELEETVIPLNTKMLDAHYLGLITAFKQDIFKLDKFIRN